ncbi:MAG: hypothetical protein II304_07935 [Bacteroidales bacterium]|nr:hypothetical protein [Bacteroidales bacterium]
MKYNLRNLLWHLKHKGLKDEPEKIIECKEQLYDAIEDNINYFTNYKENCLIANPDIFYSIPISHFRPFYGLTLDKFIEIKERFNNAVTGLFGLQYDNSASLIIADIFGHSFRASCYYRKHNKTYELCVWDMSGQRLLCQIVTKDPQLTEKQVDELEKCHDNLMESYEKSKTSANRYKQICKYKDYIRKDNYKTGYACYTYDVYVKKDIPIELTEYEIAKYVDDWNYCFGGSINKIGTTETEDVYRVKVHTD